MTSLAYIYIYMIYSLANWFLDVNVHIVIKFSSVNILKHSSVGPYTHHATHAWNKYFYGLNAALDLQS